MTRAELWCAGRTIRLFTILEGVATTPEARQQLRRERDAYMITIPAEQRLAAVLAGMECCLELGGIPGTVRLDASG